ncbi:MAG TPA: diacylglycerol kinase family protein [Anaeromyxobacteraceae bacterium]|nr:diacylglycerol kinase family protein [Anaeromyxobacteraceae bacterium]
MLRAAPARPLPEQTAVLLNANAKQVSPRVREVLSGLVPAESLFLSRDGDEAHRIADVVMSRGFETVFTGGGDGTFVSWVNHILDRAETRSRPAPRFGILALGTGNAVAEMVGAGRPVDDLRRHLSGEVLPGRRLDLVSVEGRRTPFASAGLDAAVLNDYNWLRTRLGGHAGRLTSGLRGYGLAIALRSAPRQVFQREPVYCEIVNTGTPAWRLDAAGERTGHAIEKGELLYAGPCMLAGCGTVPYYGFRLRAFPFAGRRAGAMSLRVFTRIPVPSLVLHARQIFSGAFQHPGLLDFEASDVEMTFDRPVPFQVGGDAEGMREKIALGIAPRSIELLDYSAPPSASASA